MKYSDAPNHLREEQVKYIATRWEELAGLERKWIDAVFQYLFLTSSGAAIGTLTFMGATVQAKDPVMPWIVLMLVFFVVSVLAVGAGKACQYFYIKNIYSSWRSNAATYYNNSLDWEDVIGRDTEISKDSFSVKLFSWLSFGFFFAGIVVGFSQLYGGLFNGKPIETQTTNQSAGSGDKSVVHTAIEVGSAPAPTKQKNRTDTQKPATETKELKNKPTNDGENKK